MDDHHALLGGKLQLYRRGNSRFWQCSASVGGKQWRATTKQDRLGLAQKVAEDWYLGLCGKQAAGTLVTEKTVADAAEKFTREYEVITEGERSPKWVQGHQIRLRLHLLPW